VFVGDVPGYGIAMATEAFQRRSEDILWEKAVTAVWHPVGDETNGTRSM
jgi:hypothetical protein